jgi:hypothetical protein
MTFNSRLRAVEMALGVGAAPPEPTPSLHRRPPYTEAELARRDRVLRAVEAHRAGLPLPDDLTDEERAVAPGVWEALGRFDNDGVRSLAPYVAEFDALFAGRLGAMDAVPMAEGVAFANAVIEAYHDYARDGGGGLTPGDIIGAEGLIRASRQRAAALDDEPPTGPGRRPGDVPAPPGRPIDPHAGPKPGYYPTIFPQRR